MQNSIGFYSNLALSYIRRNKRLMVPYFLMNTLIIALFYIMYATAHDTGLVKMSGGAELQIMLIFGVWVIGIFSTMMILYTSSFLMKRRKKEIGLYNILGMEKRHIGIVLVIETCIIGFLCIAFGLITGITFSKVSLMLLLKMLQFPIHFDFSLSIKAVITTVLLFVGIFTGALVWSQIQMHIVNPLELLKGSQTGEREPKSRWLITLIGMVCLFSGYYISITVKSPIQALALFFVAVVLVMIGTYLLFMTGSIVLLKRLRANVKFYYQPNHFPVISGMLYRMKQNAVGLANICLLSTMVIVTLTTTISLYAGLEDSMKLQHPMDVLFQFDESNNTIDQRVVKILQKSASEVGIAVESQASYKSINFYGTMNHNGFEAIEERFFNDKIVNVSLTDRNTYLENATESGKVALLDASLGAKESFIVNNGVALEPLNGIFTINQKQIPIYKDVFTINEMPVLAKDSLVSQLLIVMPDETAVLELSKSIQPKSHFSKIIAVDVSGVAKEEIQFAQRASENLQQIPSFNHFSSKSDQTHNFLIVYGGFLFLGIFLGSIFLIAAVLILYYKQVTEGYEDQLRYEVMQKVGMTHGEIKKAINTQTIFVFFLPLAVAIVHVAFSFNVINRLLAVFGFTNTSLFIGCTIGIIALFAVFYYFIYKATVKTYFKIVRWQL